MPRATHRSFKYVFMTRGRGLQRDGRTYSFPFEYIAKDEADAIKKMHVRFGHTRLGYTYFWIDSFEETTRGNCHPIPVPVTILQYRPPEIEPPSPPPLSAA